MEMLTVLKFGGSSLADEQRVMAAAEKAEQDYHRGGQVIAVVSAQGDTTDELISRAERICPSPDRRELDALLAAGEQMSAALMAMAIEKQGCAAVSLTGIQAGILTDGVPGDARITGLEGGRIRRELDAGRIVVVAGFQGIGRDGDVVTLGRGGSDTTAVALAAYLGADQCLIYTDVDGIYDRDPRRFPDAVRLERIGYGRMLRMAREGAQVLHDRCVELGMKHSVPIRVLSSFRPGEGTLVTD
jgi:aspartate kinase